MRQSRLAADQSPKSGAEAPTTVELGAGEPGEAQTSMLADVIAGLRRQPRAIAAKYFYDSAGSELFERISRLPEYYLTRCEREILETQGDRITAALSGDRCTVVDLGAGDGDKSRLLIARIAERGVTVEYAPVDISRSALDRLALDLRKDHPRLTVQPLAGDYLSALRWIGKERRGALLVLFLGSSIGNMTRPESQRFLTSIASVLSPGDHVLVGFDLVKDPALLQAAYDDVTGVTAKFNLNLLSRLNRELGADFNLTAFRHIARYDPRTTTMESFLLSTEEQVVSVGTQRFEIGAWEGIHTEISVKYRENEITELGRGTGFAEMARLRDSRGWFVDVLWTVEDEG